MYTVGLYTLGCKVSLYETEAIAESFADAGFEIKPFDEVCDVYVINTCTVTAESDRKARQFIRRAHSQNKNAPIHTNTFVLNPVACLPDNLSKPIKKLKIKEIAILIKNVVYDILNLLT